jgi:hypothetical protein
MVIIRATIRLEPKITKKKKLISISYHCNHLYGYSSWFLLELLVVVVTGGHRLFTDLPRLCQQLHKPIKNTRARRRKGKEGKNKDRVAFKLIYLLIQLNISRFI